MSENFKSQTKSFAQVESIQMEYHSEEQQKDQNYEQFQVPKYFQKDQDLGNGEYDDKTQLNDLYDQAQISQEEKQ